MIRIASVVLLIGSLASGQTRPTPPTRDAHTVGYVEAKELPDGTNAPADVDGNFILGPTHAPAPASTVQELSLIHI